MANLTLSIDGDLLKRARMRALERDTSVNMLVREFLERFATRGSEREGMGAFLAMTESIHAGSGPGGRTWKRDELYER